MPYIDQQYRHSLDNAIQTVTEDIELKSSMTKASPAGMVTYVVYKLIVKFFSGSYLKFATGIGVLICSAMEFYRRKIAAYEDEKIKENGDVE